MSYCELIVFKRGLASDDDSIEYHNAWGGAPFVWSNMYDHYCKLKDAPYGAIKGCWSMPRDKEDEQAFWRLHRRKDIPFSLRAVLVGSFDWAIVKRDNFKRYANDLDAFVKFFGTNDRICHLPAWADVFRTSKAQAIGLYASSVGENLWEDWDEKRGKYTKYSLNKQDKHFDVYEHLAEWDAYAPTKERTD